MRHEDITTLYNAKCDVCGSFHNVSETALFTDGEMETIIEGVQNGTYSPDNLPLWYYLRVAEALYSSVELGFGATLLELEFGSVDYLLLQELKTNIYVFSAAKTYQQVSQMTDLLVKYKDQPDLFKQAATELFQDYNSPKGANYLSAEYQTAKASARSAKNWLNIESQAEILPLLQYQTVGDARVRPEHAALDDIIRPVEDAFWGNYYPPNGWRCRCTVNQLSDGKVTSLKGLKVENVPDVFLMNSGKDRLVFSEKHPYFEVKRGDKKLALDNFNLPLI